MLKRLASAPKDFILYEKVKMFFQDYNVVSSPKKGGFFHWNPEVNKKLLGGEFWTEGYYVGTVGKYGNENVIGNYVREQGSEKDYKKLHSQQLSLFD